MTGPANCPEGSRPLSVSDLLNFNLTDCGIFAGNKFTTSFSLHHVFFKFCHRPGGSFIYCPLITSLTYKRVQFNNTYHPLTIVLQTTEIEKVDVFNGDFEEKSSCGRRDSNPRPSDPIDLCRRHAIITAWPPSGTHGRALSSCQCPGGPCSGRRQAAWMLNQAIPGSVRQERVGLHGFTFNPTLPGPPNFHKCFCLIAGAVRVFNITDGNAQSR